VTFKALSVTSFHSLSRDTYCSLQSDVIVNALSVSLNTP